ncbi:Multidrug resistance-associated protein 4 [Liparis tanakae]|uniref:Multidrug resistance-associated protein 4 n=1 Tax=Liparis tanakae TaxID=230148 RepID=A0A4Z2ELE0_9TELE|nr:Multidrug resistance-associated protein 4 [Liparis tanakae]
MIEAPTLQNVSFTVRPEQLLAVIGPVGAGKSSLLSAILGELSQESGVVKVKGELTYVSQQPWILPGTIRSNILFGKELNPKKYDRVLRACALKRDLDLLPGGDLAMVGDRGANLSGGQKSRVSLARCICGLLRKKPRILVTHQLQYLKAADEIVVLKQEEEEEEEERQGGTPISGTVSNFPQTLSDNSLSSLSSSRYSLIEGAEPPAVVGIFNKYIVCSFNCSKRHFKFPLKTC